MCVRNLSDAKGRGSFKIAKQREMLKVKSYKGRTLKTMKIC